MMANAAMTPAMKTPLMMLELASPEDGATEPQTFNPRIWKADTGRSLLVQGQPGLYIASSGPVKAT